MPAAGASWYSFRRGAERGLTMDKLTQALAPASRIDLAREADIRLGALLIRPSRREIESAGVRHLLQRRVMQVLVALARSPNAVVSHHELILRCWGGLSVSDDAIGRCIGQLRRVAASCAEPPFEIHTVAGVGYRLEPSVVVEGAAPDAVDPGAAEQAPRRRSPLLPLAAASLGLVALLLWPLRDRLPWPEPANDPRVAALPLEASGAGAQVFADALLDEIVTVLSDNQIQAVSRSETRRLSGPEADQEAERLGAGMLLGGVVRSDGRTIDVRLHLDDAREHVVIWSDQFRGPAQGAMALQTAVAAQAADVAYWAKVGRSGKVRLDAGSLAAFIAGRESTTGIRNGDDAAALSDYQKVVATAPDFSWGHSAVAASDAFLLLGQQEPQEPLRADVRREAARALALDPHNGEAYLALELALPPLDWRARESLLLQGNIADPGFEPGAMMEGRLQWFVGRGHSALGWLQRAHDINPLHDGANWTLAINLAAEGHAEEARALLAQMRAQWPDAAATKLAGLFVPVLLGDDAEALAVLADPARRPPGDERARSAWRATLAAAEVRPAGAKPAGGSPATAATEAAGLVQGAAAAGSIDHGQALLLLALLGDRDAAFAQAQLYDPASPFQPPYLFLPQTAPLRADRRFMRLAGRLGLTDYWRSTGRWPDFCFEPALPYACKAEAARLPSKP